MLAITLPDASAERKIQQWYRTGAWGRSKGSPKIANFAEEKPDHRRSTLSKQGELSKIFNSQILD